VGTDKKARQKTHAMMAGTNEVEAALKKEATNKPQIDKTLIAQLIEVVKCTSPAAISTVLRSRDIGSLKRD
jgi:hypothetical protein